MFLFKINNKHNITQTKQNTKKRRDKKLSKFDVIDMNKSI